MTPTLLTHIGTLLWGERWQAQMARELGFHRDTIQDWKKGVYCPNPHIVKRLRTLLQTRMRALHNLDDRLARL